MADTTLYFFPMSCARVAMTVLEQVGIDYDIKLINLPGQDQRTPEYLALNPFGKVPALKTGNDVLAENVAIILYLDETYPAAKLLPVANDAFARAKIRADLMWIATTLHPLVRQMRASYNYTVGEAAPVRDKAMELFDPQLRALDAKFAAQQWWYGNDWSAVDAYLGWIVSGYTSTGNDLSPYPGLVAYKARMTEHSAYARMYAKEGRLIEEANIALPPGAIR